MSANPIGGDVELDLEQVLLVRGAINAGIEWAAVADNPITPTFDSTRLPHLESASDLLGTALDQTAPGGTFRGRMTPSEMYAARMAVGFVEAELTPPDDAVGDELSINPTPDEIDRLQRALDGLAAPSDTDVAYSDWRMGVNTDAISNTIGQFDLVLGQIRAVANRDPQDLTETPIDRARRARDLHQQNARDCGQIDSAVVQLATAAAQADREVINIGSDVIDSIAGTDCFYEPIDREHLTAAWGRIQQEFEAGRGDSLDRTLQAMDLATAWFWNQARRDAASL